jgi:hypothetical protein
MSLFSKGFSFPFAWPNTGNTMKAGFSCEKPAFMLGSWNGFFRTAPIAGWQTGTIGYSLSLPFIERV